MYSPRYSSSRAIIIGINQYVHASPLQFAVNDARAVAQILEEKFGFDNQNITTLFDQDATRQNITRSFMALTGYGTELDDRVFVFFAGHGHTEPSLRGDVGFLVPHDGDPNDLASLVRWDELTRGSDLIRAKHLLFVMDACYGGLAVTRFLQPGAMRFLKDMLRRLSRQVLTSGKADETVADSGGPIPGHSIFTGHLLEGLNGKAVDADGNLTASALTSYVYGRVSKDHVSVQTPHYGHIHGDGDLILLPFEFDLNDSTDKVLDQLVSITTVPFDEEGLEMSHHDRLKELLSDLKYKIQLHDYIAQSTRIVISKLQVDKFPTQGRVDEQSFVTRLHEFEDEVKDAMHQMMLLCRWAEGDQIELISLLPKRISDQLGIAAGSNWLIESRWYPILLLLHAGGLGAIAGSNYRALFSLFHTTVKSETSRHNSEPLVIAAIRHSATYYDAFKWIPEHQRHYVPRSEYLHIFFQPIADDTLFIGSEYENTYDRFEIFLALEYLQVTHPQDFAPDEIGRAPLGRFGWKGNWGEDLLEALLKEAQPQGDRWPPLIAGLFGGSASRFNELVGALIRLKGTLGWF